MKWYASVDTSVILVPARERVKIEWRLLPCVICVGRPGVMHDFHNCFFETALRPRDGTTLQARGGDSPSSIVIVTLDRGGRALVVIHPLAYPAMVLSRFLGSHRGGCFCF